MGRPATKPHLIANHQIPTGTPRYAVHLSVWDNGSLTIGVGGGKRTQSAVMTGNQVDELARALQWLKAML